MKKSPVEIARRGYPMQFNGTNTSKTFVRLLLDFFLPFSWKYTNWWRNANKNPQHCAASKTNDNFTGSGFQCSFLLLWKKNILPYFHYCAYKTLNAISFLGILSQFGEISGELWIFFFTILHKKYITQGSKLFWRSNDNLMHLYDTVQVF